MQGSDCAGVLVLAPARQGIPCWTYVEEEEKPPQCTAMQQAPVQIVWIVKIAHSQLSLE